MYFFDKFFLSLFIFILLILDSVAWKENEKSESQANKEVISQQAAYIGNKDYGFNISKQIENEEIEKEKRRKESVNRSYASNSQSNN